jgi:thiosulfate dehydrogenase [quinone] large subunit
MFVSFLESIKYVGHLVPISFLRIFLGYYYFESALQKYSGDFLIKPKIAESISEYLPLSHAPEWYKIIISSQFIPQWQFLAFLITGFEFAIGISYLFGYVVRPMALIGIFLSANMIFILGPQTEDIQKTFLAIHFVMAWIGAGRCLGVDYYFFKRRRGFWW